MTRLSTSTSTSTGRTWRGAAHYGFTLIELMVVIAIIVLLVGLTAAVSGVLVGKSEIQRTESVLTLLDSAVEDWRVSMDRSLTWGTNGTPVAGAAYDLQINTPHLMMVSEMLCTIGRRPTVKAILAQIPDKQVARFDTGGSGTPGWLQPDPDDPDPNASATIADFNALATAHPGVDVLVILDAWDTPIRMIHPGRLIDTTNASELPSTWPAWITEQDGTVYVKNGGGFNGLEEFYGVARNRRVCFVSAGPDKKFGSVTAAVGTKLYEQSLDNMYSYEVIKP